MEYPEKKDLPIKRIQFEKKKEKNYCAPLVTNVKRGFLTDMKTKKGRSPFSIGVPISITRVYPKIY